MEITMSHLVKKFGEMLRRKRRDLGFSQEGFAVLVDIERGNYGKIERGVVNIKFETLYKITNALDCEFEDIMPSRKDFIIESNK